MNRQWRLDSKAHGLAEAFRKAPAARRRMAALVACERVVPFVGLDVDDDVKAGLRALQEGRHNEPSLRARLSALSGRFDEEYFQLAEEGDEAKKPEVQRLFAKARATSALAFALTEDASQLHETIYEAISGLVDDPTDLVRIVEATLRASAPS